MSFLEKKTTSCPVLSTRICGSTFCQVFPYHLVFDRNMTLLQVGVAFAKGLNLKLTASEVDGPSEKADFNKFFQIASPKTDPDDEIKFSWIQKLINQSFTILVKATRQDEPKDKRRTYLEVRCSSVVDVTGLTTNGTSSKQYHVSYIN